MYVHIQCTGLNMYVHIQHTDTCMYKFNEQRLNYMHVHIQHALRLKYIYTGTGHTSSGLEAVSVSTILPFSDT